MALIKCGECGTDVSSSSGQCPKCGARGATLNPRRAAITIALTMLFAGGGSLAAGWYGVGWTLIIVGALMFFASVAPHQRH